jgi:hypothetical protein
MAVGAGAAGTNGGRLEMKAWASTAASAKALAVEAVSG